MSVNSVNNVVLIGKIITQPEVSSNHDKKNMQFNVETIEIWTKDDVVKEKKENFHVVVTNNKIIDNVSKKLNANSYVFLEGKLRYEKIGETEKRAYIAVEINAGEMKIISSDKENCLNKINLIGRVGNDPEISATSDGKQICKFSFVTSERWKDKISSEFKERPEWHKVVIYSSKIIDIVKAYVKKGALLYLTGKIKVENWVDSNGQNKSNIVIVLDLINSSLKILSSKDSALNHHNTHNNEDNNRNNEFEVDFF